MTLGAKPILDQFDRVLGWHYGFTEEGLDFIINNRTSQVPDGPRRGGRGGVTELGPSVTGSASISRAHWPFVLPDI